MNSYKLKLTALKTRIKSLAYEGRALRSEAHALSGPARHSKKQDALHVGEEARILQLASGYLHGRTIARMESASSRVEKLPCMDAIRNHALRYFRPKQEEETPEEYKAEQDALRQIIETDMKAWRKQITMSSIEREARQRLALQAA